MIEALARFVEALRAEKLSVSPAEIVDAGRALDLVGVTRRDEVRLALKARQQQPAQLQIQCDGSPPIEPTGLVHPDLHIYLASC